MSAVLPLHEKKKHMITKSLMECVAAAATTAIANPQTATDMNNQKDIRLIYPQWQGGEIARWITEVEKPEDAARGYYLGALLLDFLAPDNGQPTFTVPVSTEYRAREAVDGVYDRDIIASQTRAALDILDIENPDRIVVLGGECSVSVAPFTWLAAKYGSDDVAMIWIDAHPDITLPADNTYPGYHAMAVTASMGMGDKKITGMLPAKLDASRILFVGLRDWERDEIKARQQELGIPHLTAQQVRDNSDAVIKWLRSTGASKAVIHFDMDVLDPNEIIAAVGVVPDGMKISEVVRVINDVASASELVGLTVAEPMPRTAIRIRNMLNELPLLK